MSIVVKRQSRALRKRKAKISQFLFVMPSKEDPCEVEDFLRRKIPEVPCTFLDIFPYPF